ncbi:MAG TPA: sulfite exporter TauE/SafE family protein [Saprospiraceae bacterium]|nr:sulfite exporter TauE/SafE family protein [Saprospiraceae bacterium]
MELSWIQWGVYGLAAFMFGLSKSGVKGLAIFTITIMAMAFGGRPSTGIVMPMLMVGDIFAITYYRRHVMWKHLLILLPWMLAGILTGAWMGKGIEEDLFIRIMAVLIIISVGIMVWWDIRKSFYIPESRWFGIGLGAAAGISTMLGNLAGSFTNLYFLALRLPKISFIGTAAYLYFFTNLFKLPLHIFMWETISISTAMMYLFVFPFQIIGLVTGVVFIKRINEDFFRKMILLLTALGAILIILR